MKGRVKEENRLLEFVLANTDWSSALGKGERLYSVAIAEQAAGQDRAHGRLVAWEPGGPVFPGSGECGAGGVGDGAVAD